MQNVLCRTRGGYRKIGNLGKMTYYQNITEQLKTIYLLLGIVYMFGMICAWSKFTCHCDDHAVSNFLTVIFFPIAIPIILIKDKVSENIGNEKK